MDRIWDQTGTVQVYNSAVQASSIYKIWIQETPQKETPPETEWGKKRKQYSSTNFNRINLKKMFAVILQMYYLSSLWYFTSPDFQTELLLKGKASSFTLQLAHLREVCDCYICSIGCDIYIYYLSNSKKVVDALKRTYNRRNSPTQFNQCQRFRRVGCVPPKRWHR